MRTVLAATALAFSILSIGPALAEKPAGKGGGGGGGGGSSPAASGPAAIQSVISERDRAIIRSYYGRQFAGGNCPPGLAKKNNGCLPPGQAKNWSRGQPLGSGVGYHPLPQDLLVQLTTPVGYQFVRILNDVLLIAHGTRMVADAVADLR